MVRLTVSPLNDAQTAAALPLVRMVAPEIGRDQWLSHVARLRSRGGGVLGLFAFDTLQGVAGWRPDDDLRSGRTLRVDPLVTVELTQAAPGRAALCEALERVARETGCSSLVLSVAERGYADPRSGKRAGWSALGFDLEAVTFSRRLGPQATTAAAWPPPAFRFDLRRPRDRRPTRPRAVAGPARSDFWSDF